MNIPWKIGLVPSLVWWLAAVAAVLVAVPMISPESRYVSLATNATILAIAAYGLFFLYSQVGQLSVAHASLMGIGAYTAALLELHTSLGFWAAIPISTTLAFGLGILLGVPSLRLSGHYFLVVSFAFAQLFVLAAINWREVTGGPDGLVVRSEPSGLGVVDASSLEGFYYLCASFLVVALVATTLLLRTTFCARLRAARANERLAASLGLDIFGHRLLAFGISGVFPAVAGCLYVYHLHYVEPGRWGADGGITLILILILGGGLMTIGPVLGAILFTFVPDAIGLSPNASRMAYGAALVVIILVCKQGVAGLAAGLFSRGRTMDFPVLRRVRSFQRAFQRDD